MGKSLSSYLILVHAVWNLCIQVEYQASTSRLVEASWIQRNWIIHIKVFDFFFLSLVLSFVFLVLSSFCGWLAATSVQRHQGYSYFALCQNRVYRRVYTQRPIFWNPVFPRILSMKTKKFFAKPVKKSSKKIPAPPPYGTALLPPTKCQMSVHSGVG